MPEPIRTAFVGGSVWTAGYAHPRRLDVLVEGRRIVDVTTPGELDAIDAQFRRIPGRLLVPGFQDAHLHLGAGGFDLLTLDLSDAATPYDVYARVAAYAESLPADAWVTGGGWDRTLFPLEGPGLAFLDRIVGGRPTALSSFDRHGAWVSSAALAAAGVGADTPDPDNGSFRRDTGGALTGMVEESALAVIRAVMPAPSGERIERAILAAQDRMLSYGITSVQDALVGTGLGMVDQLESFARLLETRRLTLRLTAALWWDPRRGLDQIDELVSRRDALHASGDRDRIVADTVKIMVDGSDTVFVTPAQVEAATVALDAAGFAVHYHSYGDATTHSVLDAVEAAIEANGPRPRRHQIAHLFFIAPEDFRRFGALGVTANVQGFWAGTPVPHEHLEHSTMTPDPETREYPFGRLAAAGASFAAGSDWPVTTADPLQAISAGTGLLEGRDGRRALDDRDRLDLVTMLTAYTAGSALVNGRPDRTGRIAPGFLADIAVLDQDIFDEPEALLSARAEEVWVDGRLAGARVGAALPVREEGVVAWG